MADEPRLRVLQVASSLYEWGGIERYVSFLQQGLEEKGHVVEIACPPLSPLAERSHRSTYPLEIRRKFDLKGFAAYLRLFRSDHFDIVHGHFSPDFTLPAYAAKLRKQGCTVMTRHVAKRWSRPKARQYAKLWDHIIPVSHAVERRLLESGIPSTQMTVAKAGLPEPVRTLGLGEARSKLGIAPEECAVGSFGRLVPEKGIDVLVSAMQELPRIRLLVFGHGPEEESLRAQARGMPNVQLMGQVADVTDAMAAMDAIAIPSTWEEPFPYAALEAMALARPIVASDTGGLPEMVRNGVNGRLFPKGDAGTLAAALRSLMEEPDAWHKMGEAGRERYLNEFTVEKMASRIEAVYHRVLGR